MDEMLHCVLQSLPLFCLSISSFSFLACMDISRRLFTELIMSSGSGSGSTFTSFLLSFLVLLSFFFSPLSPEEEKKQYILASTCVYILGM